MRNDVPDEIAQQFVDAAMTFAKDLVTTIASIEEEYPKTAEARMARRMKCRQDFINAYFAVMEAFHEK